jgi:hypothetical protein
MKDKIRLTRDPISVGGASADMTREFDPSLFHDLSERGIHFINKPHFGSYDGSVVMGISGRKLWVEVEDNGWHVLVPGEADEDDRVTREATGCDCLTIRVEDLDTGQKWEQEEEIPEENIHGPVYAAMRMVDPETPDPEHYYTYLTRFVADLQG